MSGFIASASILKNGKIIAAAAEERFTRIKHDKSFPHNAIQFCLQKAGINFSQLNKISVGWNPSFYMTKNSGSMYPALRDRGLFLYYVINELGSAGYVSPIQNIEQTLFVSDKKIPLEYVNHHLAHASYSFYFSGFPSALILVLDGFGEVHTGGLFKFSTKKYETISTCPFPHSLGLFYSTFTQFLGFRPHVDEWKIMAMAASGKKNEFKRQLDPLVKIGKKTHNGLLELDLSYFDFFNFYNGCVKPIFI